MIVAGTGHRPEDCEDESVVRAKARAFLVESGATTFICGMASGFDLWAADEARLLGIEVWAARPWRTHTAYKKDAELYATILDYASKVVVVTDSVNYRGPKMYFDRNHWMVDHADEVVAYWSGKPSGGTFECRNYAINKKVPVTNIYG